MVVTADDARRFEQEWAIWNDLRWWVEHDEEIRNTYPSFLPHIPDETWSIPSFPLEGEGSIRIGGPNRSAGYWARRRAAELLGMARSSQGALVPNPDPRWRISEPTRLKIRQVIADGFDSELSPIDGNGRPPYLRPGGNRASDVVDHIKVALDNEFGVSSARSRVIRARIIASTEISRAQVGSNLNIWRKTGVVKRVRWLCAAASPCAACCRNRDLEVEFGKPFPSGACSPLDTHPICTCTIVPVV